MSAQSLSIWCILTAVFWFDATLTLLRRCIQGSAWMKPHKQHAYQRLHQMGWKVSHIVLSSLGVNGILGMIALCVYYHRLSAGMGLSLAIAGLSLIYLWIEQQQPMRIEKKTEAVINSLG